MGFLILALTLGVHVAAHGKEAKTTVRLFLHAPGRTELVGRVSRLPLAALGQPSIRAAPSGRDSLPRPHTSDWLSATGASARG
jgi:hypothetical protein